MKQIKEDKLIWEVYDPANPVNMNTFKNFYEQPYKLIEVNTPPVDTKSAEKTSTAVLIPESIFKEFIYFKLISRNNFLGHIWDYKKNKTDRTDSRNSLIFAIDWYPLPRKVVVCNGRGFAMSLKSNIDLTVSIYLDLLKELAVQKQSLENVHDLNLDV